MKPIDADALREKFADVLNSTYTDDYAKGFVAGLYAALNMPTLTPPNEWVSVDDELPETAGEYLVVYHPCHWDNVSAKICVGIDSFRGKTAWAKKKYQRVTHWMPLPAPPAKVDES